MSDIFLLCPKCGDEVEKTLLGYKDVDEVYVCPDPKCRWFGSYDEARIASTEYFLEEPR